MTNTKKLDIDEGATGAAWQVENLEAYDPGQTQIHDEVFGEISDTGPNYRNVRSPMR